MSGISDFSDEIFEWISYLFHILNINAIQFIKKIPSPRVIKVMEPALIVSAESTYVSASQ